MRMNNGDFKNSGRALVASKLTASAVGLAVCLTAILTQSPATAQEFTFHAEPAAALWLSDPQADRFTPGFYGALRPGVALGRVLALQWSYALLLTPAGEGYSDLGTAHFLMAGLRLRPFAPLQPKTEQLGGLFVDFNAGYVRTDDLDRFGFDAGLGYGFQVSPSFSLGPVVRYVHIVQPDSNDLEDPNNGQFVTLGIDFGFGGADDDDSVSNYDQRGPINDEVPVKECEKCPPAKTCPPTEKCAPVVECPKPCADGDKDSVCDNIDRCPTEVGPPATFGCPPDPCRGAPLMVLVQFPYDSSRLPKPVDGDTQTMDPVLDAVAKAISQDPTCRVCIVGHASDEGAVDYNQTLSTERAEAVRDYMTARGVSTKRIPFTGLGARCQMVPEASRELNRRVEFRRLQEGESCPSDCSEPVSSTTTTTPN